MSYLLNSGIVGVVDKDRNSISYIYGRWKNLGFIDSLDYELGVKVSVALEVAAHILLMEGDAIDIHSKYTGQIIDDNDASYRVDTVMFPIIRRIVAAFPEAHKYVPEIVIMAKKEYNTHLCKYLYSEHEPTMIYFYEKVLPVWSNWHKDREHEKYEDCKRKAYEKHVERCKSNGHNRFQPYEEFKPMDLEAEFCAYVASKIEKTLIQYVKR